MEIINVRAGVGGSFPRSPRKQVEIKEKDFQTP